MDKFENYYETLNVINFAEVEVIKASYKALSKKYHPDLNKGINPDIMIKINNAYDVLSDINKKKQYDEELKIYLDNEENDFTNDNDHYSSEEYADSIIYEELSKINPFRIILAIFIGFIFALIGSFIIVAIVPLEGSWSYIIYTIYGIIIGSIMKFISKSNSVILGGIGFCITLVCMLLPHYIYLYDVMPIVYGEMGAIGKFMKATQEVVRVLLGSGFIRLIFVLSTPLATFSTIFED